MVLAALLAAPPAAAADPGSQVRSVADGRTLLLEDGTRMRLWGIDVPALGQRCDDARGKSYRCGIRARAALQALVRDRDIRCRQRDGTTASCLVEGRDLGEQLVRDGWAFDLPSLSKGLYRLDEKFAAGRKLGMWAGRFERPEEYRKARSGR